MIHRYLALFAKPEVSRTFQASVIGHLPIGLTGLAILLLVQTATLVCEGRRGVRLLCLGAGYPRAGHRPAHRSSRAAFSAARVHGAVSAVAGRAGRRARAFALFVAYASPAVVLCFATAFGFLEIGVTAFASETGNAALAGVLLGLMSFGSAVCGLAYGGRTWRAPLARQFAAALALVSAGLGLLSLGWSAWPFAAWCVLAGVAMAPGLIIQSMLAARIASAQYATEAFTWTTSALLAGVGIGLTAGGVLLEQYKLAGVARRRGRHGAARRDRSALLSRPLVSRACARAVLPGR